MPRTKLALEYRFTHTRVNFKPNSEHIHQFILAKWFFFDILSFPEFFDSFILTQTIGVCTDEALDFASSPPNPFLYRYCVCCGDYKPDAALNCPIKSWK
jgi:hypothetical protein